MAKAAREKMEQGGKQSSQKQESSSSPRRAEGTEKSTSEKKSEGKEAGKEGGSEGKYGKDGPQPKILNENPPQKGEESEGVRRHNEEMDHRADKAHEGVSNHDAEKDKVSGKFWSGE